LSGIDEQLFDECPECHRVPKYWTLGNLVCGGLIWLYTENYDIPDARNSIRLSRLENVEGISATEHRINYVWCSACFKQFENTMFIKDRIKRAKALEERGRVDLI